jgi:hypothetical protein
LFLFLDPDLFSRRMSSLENNRETVQFSGFLDATDTTDFSGANHFEAALSAVHQL